MQHIKSFFKHKLPFITKIFISILILAISRTAYLIWDKIDNLQETPIPGKVVLEKDVPLGKNITEDYFNIEGRSMNPLLIDKCKYKANGYVYENIKEIQRGDIIIFKDIYNRRAIKRVIGLPNDLIELRTENFKNLLYINGRHYPETYIKNYNIQHYNANHTIVRVKPNCVYVLGDNRKKSEDSSQYKEPNIHFSKIIKKITKLEIIGPVY